jgi:hypothetical protein
MAKPNKRNEREYERILAWIVSEVGSGDPSYKRWGGEAVVIALLKHSKVEFESGLPFSSSCEELKGALLAFKRANRHAGTAPEAEEMNFIRALFAAANP